MFTKHVSVESCQSCDKHKLAIMSMIYYKNQLITLNTDLCNSSILHLIDPKTSNITSCAINKGIISNGIASQCISNYILLTNTAKPSVQIMDINNNNRKCDLIYTKPCDNYIRDIDSNINNGDMYPLYNNVCEIANIKGQSIRKFKLNLESAYSINHDYFNKTLWIANRRFSEICIWSQDGLQCISTIKLFDCLPRNICRDLHGNILIACDNGIHIYDPRKFDVIDRIAKIQNCVDVCVDSDNCVYVCDKNTVYF